MPFNLLQDGFVRVAAAVPAVAPGAVSANAAAVLELTRRAHADGCDLVVFPELALTGYTCADLFHQDTLLDAAESALADLLEQTRDLTPVLVIGLPLRAGPCLFNAAAVLCAGRLLGVAVKSFPPNYGEFYEARWFTPGHQAPAEITLAGTIVPCGPDLLFAAAGRPEFAFGVEICEDLWAPEPPGGALALAGAVLLCNPSASDELVGKAAYRRQLVAQQAGRCLAGYVYVSAGPGESTTDVVYGGHALVAENGVLLAEGERFVRGPVLTVADVDAAFLRRERRVNRTFTAAAARHRELRTGGGVRRITFTQQPVAAHTALRRTVNPHPFVPADTAERDARCAEIFAIQSSGLATRLARTGLKSVTLGVSGGLDSTLALLVCAEAFARLG
ncbi:MAG: nitrilase-related carbon-nitrogen hydrolase, partial [bacterium]